MKLGITSISKKVLLIPALAVAMSGTAFAVSRNQTDRPASTSYAHSDIVATKYQAPSAEDAKKADQAKQVDEKAKAAEAAKTNAQLVASTSPQSYPAIAAASPKGKGLYVSPATLGRQSQINAYSTAQWFGGWTSNVTGSANNLVTAATNQGTLATIVAYNIPARDCGSYSAGGAGSSADYRLWIRALAAGIGRRQAIVIVEPDALAQISCLDATNQATRYADLSDAVNVLATQTKSFVYLDAGHSAWIDAATMVQRLQKANVAQARGFSLNVSNFQTTASNTSYGNLLAAKLGKNFVIDTSRNGLGPNGEWCNPHGRALGERPTTNTPGYVDAYLWIKQPGESDGECNGGPAAGVWWDAYAQELIQNAGL